MELKEIRDLKQWKIFQVFLKEKQLLAITRYLKNYNCVRSYAIAADPERSFSRNETTRLAVKVFYSKLLNSVRSSSAIMKREIKF